LVLQTNGPFTQEQANWLNLLLPTLTEAQRIWLSGYLAGAGAAQGGPLLAFAAMAGGAPWTQAPVGALAASAGTREAATAAIGLAQGPAVPAPARAAAASEAPAGVSGAAASPAPREATVLFGSQSGNSQKLAKKLAAKLEERGYKVALSAMNAFKPNELKNVRNLFIVISTHGEGDPPDNARSFYDFLHGKRAPRLDGVRFSVLALGDSSYELFCKTGKDFDQRLEELGGVRLAPRVDCDVDFEQPAAAWMESALKALDEATAGEASAGMAQEARQQTDGVAAPAGSPRAVNGAAASVSIPHPAGSVPQAFPGFAHVPYPALAGTTPALGFVPVFPVWGPAPGYAVIPGWGAYPGWAAYPAAFPGAVPGVVPGAGLANGAASAEPAAVASPFAASATGIAAPAAPAAAPAPSAEPAYSRSNPFHAEVIENLNLNGRGSDRETRHVELSLAGSGLQYEPGDCLAVIPENRPELVDELIREAGWRAEEPVPVDDSGAEAPLREALLKQFEITVLTRPLLEKVAETFGAGGVRELLAPGKEQELRDYLRGRDLLDLIRDHGLKGVPARELVKLLRRIPARKYSIASSLKAYPDEAHLTVRVVRYHAHGRDRYGVCTTYLAERAQPGDTVPVYVHHNPNFKLPADPDAPIVMIGPGTGVAPFRAFLQEREATGASGKTWLFYGDRHFRTDFLYQTEWQRWLKDGVLTRMDVAFSRDTERKVYVQHRMLEQSRELFRWLDDGAYVYVCGDEKNMAPDVHAALLAVLQKEGGLSEEAARERLDEWQRQNRYQRDVY